jgi:hypothetical protein
MSNVFVNIVLKNDLKELTQKVKDIEISKGEVDTALVDDTLVDYLTNDDEIYNLLEDALYDASLVGDNTTYEWQDPTNEIGGTF